MNMLVAKLWPRINKVVQKVAYETVTPQIREKLPHLLQSHFGFTKFTLGSTPLVLGPIEFYEKPEGLKLEIGINLHSSIDIEMHLGATVGIKSIRFSGKLVLQLGPLIDESPIVGGVVAYFIDPPNIDLDFTGLANVADAPGLAGIVRGVIESVVEGVMVLPNVISVPLATEQQVDRALLSMPKPLGVLRVAAVKAAGLTGADLHLFSKATSDPYVKVTLADREWRSSTVKETCDPTWTEEDCHDFIVFDRDQKLSIQVYDEDRMSRDDLLGGAKPLMVSEALESSLVPIALLEDVTPHCSDAARRGDVTLRFEWLKLIPGQLGTMGSCLVVEVHKIILPTELGRAAAFSVKIGDEERRTPVVAAAPKAIAGTTQALQEVVTRCKENGIDCPTTVKITGLTEECVAELRGEKKRVPGAEEAAGKEAAGLKFAKSTLDVERVLYLPVSADYVQCGALDLSVLDIKGKKVLGKGSLELKEVIASPGLTYSPSDPHGIWLIGEGGQKVQVQVTVSLLGLLQDGEKK